MVKKNRKGKTKKEQRRSKKWSGPAHQQPMCPARLHISLIPLSSAPPQLSPKSLSPSLAPLSPVGQRRLGGGRGSQAAAPRET